MALHGSFLFLLELLAENVFVFRVGLAEVCEPESLPRFQFTAALRIALRQQVYPPFNFCRRTLPAAPEILVVFDLQLPDIFFDLAEIFVNGGHGDAASSNYAKAVHKERQRPAFHKM